MTVFKIASPLTIPPFTQMKKFFLFAFCLYSLSSIAQTTYPAGVSGCIAHYDFTGATNVIADVSSNNHPAYGYNITPSLGFRNRVGRAMHFNGTNSVARATPSTQFDLSQLTICALIKFDGFYSGLCQDNALVNRTVNYWTPGSWGLGVGDGTYDNNCSTFSPNNEQAAFISSSFSAPNVPAGNYLTTGNWYFITGTYDGTTFKLYQTLMDTNNKLTTISPIATVTMGVTLGVNTDSLFIGGTGYTTYPYWLNADFGDLAIFNRALSNTEVKAVYDYLWGNGVGVKETTVADEVKVNYTGSKLTIINTNQSSPLKIWICDMSGQKLMEMNSSDPTTLVDMGDNAAGIYIVHIQNKNSSLSKKIAKF